MFLFSPHDALCQIHINASGCGSYFTWTLVATRMPQSWLPWDHECAQPFSWKPHFLIVRYLHRLYKNIDVVTITSPVGFWRAVLKLKVSRSSRRHLGSTWLCLTPSQSKMGEEAGRMAEPSHLAVGGPVTPSLCITLQLNKIYSYKKIYPPYSCHERGN